MVDLSNKTNIREFIDEACSEFSSRSAYRTKRRFRTEQYTYKQMYDYVRMAGPYFESLGIKKQDKILIIAPNSVEFAILLWSSYYHNIVAVPADVRFSLDLIKKYYNLVEPKKIFTTKIREKEIATLMKDYVIIEDLFEELSKHKSEVKGFKLNEIKGDDLAEIMFTSGTTGTPKGVMITQYNMIAALRELEYAVPKKYLKEGLSILPLSHVFEQIITLFIGVLVGRRISFVRKVNSLAIKQALNEWGITQLIIVPQVLKNLYRGIEKEAEKKGKGKIFKKMNSIAGHLPHFLRKILFRTVHKQLGGEIAFIVSAGAKLDVDIAQKWENMGFKIMEGYGATELTGPATVNYLEKRKIGSVGVPFPHVKVKTDKNKEVLVNGDNVAKGYYKNEEKTKEAFTKNGWYRTGDMGEIRDDGRLYLLGRDAFKIVLSSGENVFVEDIESVLNQEKEIWESCVIPIEKEGREQVHALILPGEDCDKQDVERGIRNANEKLEQHQQVVSHSIWSEEDFPRTLTQKINRKVVIQMVKGETKEDPQKQKEATKEVRDVLLELVKETANQEVESLDENKNLGSDLGMDSIDRVELIAMIEDRMEVVINDYKVNAQTTIKNLRKMIEEGSGEQERIGMKEKIFSKPFKYLRLGFQKIVIFPVYSLFIHVKVEGKENIESLKQPVLFYFNHIGPLDGLAFLKELPSKISLNTAVSGQENFWKAGNRIFRFLLEYIGGAFPVSALGEGGAKAGLERIGRLLDLGNNVTFAPEGKMSRSGKLQRFQSGAGIVASEMMVPVILVKISGNYNDVFRVPKKSSHEVPISYYLPRMKRAKMKVKFSKPINVTDIEYDEARVLLEDTMKKM